MKLELARLRTTSSGARDARRSWEVRERLLVRLTDDAGLSGIGEAAPLPGYSLETIDEVNAALTALDVRALRLDAAVREALASAAALLPRSLPSARFALETALLDLLGKQRALPAPELLGAEHDALRPLAALLGPASEPGLVASAERAVTAGYRCLKSKLGSPGMLDAELAGVSALRSRFGTSISLRLDANGTLAASELECRADSLSALSMELFEEPGGPLPADLPLALDESLQGLTPDAAEALWQTRGARAVVLKPTSLGGIDHCLTLAERATKAGLAVVISHTFEGQFAWRAAAAVALALPNGAAHGLAPHPGLGTTSPLELPVQDGHLRGWTARGLGTMSSIDWP